MSSASTRLPRFPESYEDWLAAPVDVACPDPRFEVRRAQPADFASVYALLDRVFEAPRSRRRHDWLYRENPLGTARCWITIERESGEMVGTDARLPWPIARGDEPLPGEVSADTAIAPRLQRSGAREAVRSVRVGHPWRTRTAAIAFPNEKSRGFLAKYGRGDMVYGPLPRAVLPLRAAHVLGRLGEPFPGALRAAVERPAEALLRSWLRLRLASNTTVRPVSRFDASFDSVTARTMRRDGYWCPHSWEFLNWRYLEHPEFSYAAFASLGSGEPSGYAVVRLAPPQAILMEFAAPAGGGERCALLASVVERARESGCLWLEIVSSPVFRQWSFLRSVGFVARPGELYLWTQCPAEAAHEPSREWLVLPGDADPL